MIFAGSPAAGRSTPVRIWPHSPESSFVCFSNRFRALGQGFDRVVLGFMNVLTKGCKEDS